MDKWIKEVTSGKEEDVGGEELERRYAKTNREGDKRIKEGQRRRKKLVITDWRKRKQDKIKKEMGEKGNE